MNSSPAPRRLVRGTGLLAMTMLLAALALIAAPPPVAHAATIIVTTADDELNDDGDCSLREAIQAANTNAAVSGCTAGQAVPNLDTITFATSTNGLPIYLAGDTGDDLNASGDLDILDGGDLTIQGNGAVNTIIDGSGNDRVFHVCPGGGCAGSVTFNGVTLRNGSADFGGGILNLGSTLNVQDCTIGGAGVGNTASDEGGGIDNQQGTTTVRGTTISANRSEYGGGICNHATLNVQNGSTIGGVGVSNVAEDGGGIHNYAGTTTVEASTVISNTASRDGGGIYNYAGTTNVVASAVISNTADDDGGGIHNQDGTTTVDASTISANAATGDGGGIYNHATLHVQNGSTIGGAGGSNTADNGGGIHNFDGQATVDGSTVSGNKAKEGGGIYNHFDATLNVQNGSTIGGAGAANEASQYGGGIYNHSATTTVDGNTVSANTAIFGGGGIHNQGGDITVNSSTVNANLAIGDLANGGGIYNEAGTTIVDGSIVSANGAIRHGGGIFSGGTLIITDSTIGGAGAGNEANLAGGGIYSGIDGETTVEGSTVSANVADYFGGGIANWGPLNVSNSTIGGVGAGNTATRGGGIYNGDHMNLIPFIATVTGSCILHNQATTNGGGVYNDEGIADAVQVTGSSIVGNSDTSFFNNWSGYEQVATGNWWGAAGGPGAPGADTVSAGVDYSGYLTTTTLACIPDLQVDKANNTGGNGTFGTPFHWTLTVANTGGQDAAFSAGQRILADDLPSGPTYGPPVVGNIVGVTNGAKIGCSIMYNILTCKATGAKVTIGATTGRFDVIVTVTPRAGGALKNPAGNCLVDPDGHVIERDEANNDCPADTVDVFSWTVYLPLVMR